MGGEIQHQVSRSSGALPCSWPELQARLFQGLIGVIANGPSHSSLFPSNKAHFHIMSTLLTRRSVEVESHGPEQECVWAGTAPLSSSPTAPKPLSSKLCTEVLRRAAARLRYPLSRWQKSPAQLQERTRAALSHAGRCHLVLSSQKRGLRRLVSEP